MRDGMRRFSCNLRSTVDGNRITGHAAVFNQTAYIPGEGYERLSRSAFDHVLSSGDTDVRALFNHDPNRLLGRQSAGTLKLDTDDDGLVFEVDLPDTSYARDIRELAKRGDLDGASFAWVPGKATPDTAPDGKRRMTHTEVSRLIDVSVVTFPAYQGTDVALRSMNTVSRNRSRLIRARARVTLKVV